MPPVQTANPPSPRWASAPWIVLVGMLMLTGVAAEYVRQTTNQAERQQYHYAASTSAHEIRDAIRDRIHTYVGLLRGAAGLFAADRVVSREQFHEYVQRLDLERNYRGVLGIGWAPVVPPGTAAELEQQLRLEGEADYHIRPSPEPRTAVPVAYIEPHGPRNNTALGYDMYSDPVRREAMDRARDTGTAAASGKVTLKQELDPDPQSGFLIYVPVYRGGGDPVTLEARRAGLLGFVYCPFRAGDLLQGIGDEVQSSLVDFTVYDGAKIAIENHLHHTGTPVDAKVALSLDPSGAIPADVLDVAGRTWTLAYRQRPEVEPRTSRAMPLAVLLVGGTFAFVLFLVTSAQARARAEAERAAAELRRSQAALQRSEASLRRLVESNLIGVVITEPGGSLVEANDAFLSITGYSRADLADGTLNYQALTPGASADSGVPSAAPTGGPERQPPVEKEYLRKDGSRVPVLVGTTALEGDRRSAVSFVVDLTELRKARDAMAESERRFRTLIEQSPLGIQIFARDGSVLLANHAWELMWGVKLSENQGYNVLQDLQLEKIGLTPYVLQAFAGESTVIPPFRYDPVLSGRTGRPRWVQFYFYPVRGQAGEVREIVLILHDLTEVKEAEEALKRSEEQLRLVIDALPVLVGYIDQDKRFRLSNELYGEWFDRPASEIEGRLLAEVIGEDVYRQIEPQVELALAGERVSYDRNMTFPDGSRHDLHVTLIPHVGLAGHVEGFVAVIADVTERKQAENERNRLLKAEQEARTDAETANRTKDEFLATLSHELRTPLNAILGWAQLLRMGGLPPEDIGHGLEAIERNAKVQAQLVEDLLDLSRIISGKLRLETKPIDLPTVLDAALDSVRPAAEAKGIRLIPLLDASASPVLGDAGRLQQVIWNLLSNAIKFTPAKGKVELILQRMNGHAEILVSDTGMGINPAFLPYVFDRLRQADSSSTRRHGGLGLGLSIARHLIESHGGTIEARSEGEGRGATFVVSLPLSLNAVVKDNLPSRSTSDTDVGGTVRRQLDGVRVLVVDDEADARDLVSRVLRHDGAEVRTAESGAEALRAIDEQHPDVLVSDIAMPDQDGYELIRQVRLREPAQGGRLPAIALTAFARKEDRDKAIRAGYQTHLSKPVEPFRLSAAVAELARH